MAFPESIPWQVTIERIIGKQDQTLLTAMPGAAHASRSPLSLKGIFVVLLLILKFFATPVAAQSSSCLKSPHCLAKTSFPARSRDFPHPFVLVRWSGSPKQQRPKEGQKKEGGSRRRKSRNDLFQAATPAATAAPPLEEMDAS